jgi:hypothetical protein
MVMWCVELRMIQVKRIHVEKRENPIVNRLNKTKTEKYPDLREEKEARLKELRRRDQDGQQARVSTTRPVPSMSCISPS